MPVLLFKEIIVFLQLWSSGFELASVIILRKSLLISSFVNLFYNQHVMHEMAWFSRRGTVTEIPITLTND